MSRSSNQYAEEDWQRIQDLFAIVVDMPESERGSYLDASCVDEPMVRAEVESLLDSFAPSKDELENSPLLLDQSNGNRPSIDIPGYQILAEISRGGQGVVYRALQISTKREVALKVLLRGPFADRSSKLRFEREVELVARLRHPGIVPVFDSGEANGQNFYAMEFVRGRGLDEWARDADPTQEEKLRLFFEICEAVGHAHQHGVIHRDIKPSNVLIDDGGRPSVVDFGLAKLGAEAANDGEEQNAISLTGQIMGTLSYMSPEQANGQQDEVDTRSDVYSLGVMLYELLWGETPYQLEGSLYNKIKTIQNAEPNDPSDRQTSDELVTIIRKAISKEKNRRYATATALGDDIDRYLRGYPIEAKRDSTLYVLGKTMRRYRIAVSVAASFLLIVIASACIAWGLYLSADQAWQQEKKTSEELRVTSAKHLEASTNYRLASEKYQRERDIAEGLRKEGNQKLYYAKMILAGQAASTPGGNQVIADLTSQWKPQKDGIDHRGWEWFYLSSQCNRELTSTAKPIQGLSIARWSHDGKRLAVGGYRALRLFDENLAREPLVKIQHKRELLSLAWNHDDTRLATGGSNEQIYIWDTSNDSLKLLSGITFNGRIDGLSWSRNGAELAAMNHLGALRIWNVDEGKRVAKIDGLQPGRFSVSWHPTRELLAVADGGTVKIIKKGGKVLKSLKKPGNEIRAMAWNCYGTRLAAVAGDGRTVVWNAETEEELWSHVGGGELEDVVWHPNDDYMLATASRDRSVRVFNAQSGYIIREIKGHGGAVRSVDWHPSGDRMVTTNRDQFIRVWPASNQGVSHAIRYYSRFETKRIECSPDGKLIACVGIGPKVKFIRTDNEEHRHVLHPGFCHALAWKPGEQTIATTASDGTVRLWTDDANEPFLVFDGHRRGNESADNKSVMCVDWSPDGKRIVSGDWQKKAIVWSAETGEILNEFTHHRFRLEVARWHPTRSLIISGSTIGRILIWDAMTGEVRRELPADMKAYLDIQWNAAGDEFATASMDSLAKIWQLDQEEPKFVLKGHSGPVRCVQWHPSGTRIATSSDDGTVKVWSTESGDEVLTIQVSEDPVWGIDWSIDGEKLYSASDDGIIRVWDSSHAYQQQRANVGSVKRE